MLIERAVLIYNPAAGRARRRAQAVAELVQRAAALSIQVEAEATRGPGDATRIARQAAAAGAPLVIAYGGDGTANEVAQALAGTATALAVWPGGTANVLARVLGMPRAPARMAARIAAARLERITLGQAGSRYFLLMAGIGLDASVVAGVRPHLKRRLGQGAFVLSALEHLLRWQPSPFTVQWDDTAHHDTGAFAVIGNCHGYGGGFRMTPGARLDDEALEVCLFQGAHRRDYLRYLVPAYFGRHTAMADVTCRKATALAVAGTAPVQVDGELAGYLPMQFRAVPHALAILR